MDRAAVVKVEPSANEPKVEFSSRKEGSELGTKSDKLSSKPMLIKSDPDGGNKVETQAPVRRESETSHITESAVVTPEVVSDLGSIDTDGAGNSGGRVAYNTDVTVLIDGFDFLDLCGTEPLT